MSKRRKKTPGSGNRYQHPIPSRRELIEHIRQLGRPVSAERLLEALDLKGKRWQKKLQDKLAKMVRAGQVIRNRQGQYCLVERLDLLAGKVTGHRDGFGFVDLDEGDEDVFLSAREMRAVFDGDRVLVRIVDRDRRGRPEGTVVEVLQRGVQEIAGQFIRERGNAVVVPDNPRLSHRLLIARGAAGGAKHGDIVIARVLDYPTDFEQATGEITRVVGKPDAAGIATEIAIHSHAIPFEWPKSVRKAIKQFGEDLPDAAKKGRVDLREMSLVTIDGADARDFDDAVYAEPSGKGFRLVVAIADVSHYVDIGSALDKEAIKRGTSVYFPDRVVPMLPEVLSNGLCSLNPQVDRLCMVCDMRVSQEGKVTRAKFYDAVMRSKARLTYSQVSDLLTGQKNSGVPKAIREDVRNLHAVFRLFANNRRRRGAVELDIPQTRIELGKDGAVKRIAAVARNDAHRLIEEFMIAANVQAAKFIRRHKIAGLYRNHAKPDPDRFDELRNYLESIGVKKVPHPDHVQPRDFAKIIEQVADRPDISAISMAMLRSMMQAVYEPTNIGHFGLALDAYAHFTSPIRRYPDLLVHRAIRHITGGGKPRQYDYDGKRMKQLGESCSSHERRAEEATREVEAWLKCQYMEARVGEKYPGVITGVTEFGVFVQIPELQVDGLVHVSTLGRDYYLYDASKMALVGERTGQHFRLGDALEVIVARVDMETRRIDFQPAMEQGRRNGRKRQ